MSMILLRSRLSFLKGLAPFATTRTGFSGSSRGPPAGALGGLRVTVRASLPGMSPRTSYSSHSEHPVRFPGDFAGPSHGALSISFGAPSVDRMSITASGDGFTSSEDEGAVGPPSPEPSRLDDWFLGAGRGSQPVRPPNAPPFVPFTPTPFCCITTGTSIVLLDPLAQRLEAWLTLPACLAGSRAQFDSATRFSSPGDLPSSTAFSRRWWQSGTPLSCARRLLSSWQRMQSSRSLQPR